MMCTRSILVATLLVAATSAPNADAGDLSSPEVYARLMVLAADVEKLRFEMGRPKPGPRALRIAKAAPHEVYFQVATVLRKANRLSFEQTREIADPPPPPSNDIRREDVLNVVERVQTRIDRVKTDLGIGAVSPRPPPEPGTTVTDVFNASQDVNRQLNLLLDRPFSPADVYEQLTQAIAYAARLRSRFPGDRIPETPDFERGKQPEDVFQKLEACFALIHEIATQPGLPILMLEGEVAQEQAEPSDVYDMATLLVSELDYLWRQAGNLAPPHRAFYPGRRLSSHAYQRAGLLERQLAELAELVQSNPAWLVGR
jgi:hypothetical protein